MNKLYYILILISFFFSCETKTNHIHEDATIVFKDNDFQDIHYLKGEFVKSSKDSVFFPSRIISNNNYLFVSEEKTDKFLHVFELPSEKYVGIYGDKGKGPGEILVSWSLSLTDDGDVLVLDPKRKKAIKIDIDSLLLKKNFFEESNFPKSSHNHDIIFHDDEMYINDQNIDKFRFVKSDFQGKIIEGYGRLPQNKYFRKNEDKGRVSRAFMVNEKETFAFAYLYYPLIELYNVKKNEYLSIVGPNIELPSANFIGRELVYRGIRLTKNKVYALYEGKKGNSNANIIYVFERSGRPLKKLILDKDIFTFDIYRDSLIYGLNFNESKIFKFNIQ